MANIIYIDFKEKVLISKSYMPKVSVWQCSVCLGAYAHTEGYSNNTKSVNGGSSRYPVRVCEKCIHEMADILKKDPKE